MEKQRILPQWIVVRLGNDPPGYDGGIAGAAYGLGLLVVILAAIVLRGLTRPAGAAAEMPTR